MSKSHGLWLTVIAIVLVGCTNAAAAQPSGSAERGRAFFAQSSVRNTAGCVTCHSLEQGKVVVGPSLAGVATRAAATVGSSGYQGTAKTAEAFLRESITRPNAAVATGFSHNIMPDWLTVLDRQQIEDLVAFLMTQR